MRQNLFSKFLPVSKTEWQDHVRKTGKIDPETLLWDTLEGFKADPYQDRSSTKHRRDPLFQHEHITLLKPVNTTEGDGTAENPTLLFDPFTHFLGAETESFSHETILEPPADLVNHRDHLLCVDGSFYAKAGATIIEQVAFITAVLAEILSSLSPKSRAFAAKEMLVKSTAGPLYFPEIAKLRALRILWANLLNAFELPANQKLVVISETSFLFKTDHDIENNLIRNTAEALASIAGGANYLLIHPHNRPFDESDSFTRRMADNLFHILNEEASATAVADPAAGSFYIENLTDIIAEEAWSLFQEIEREGGFMEAIKSGFIQKRIKASAEERKRNLASGDRAVVGFNIFKSGSAGGHRPAIGDMPQADSEGERRQGLEEPGAGESDADEMSLDEAAVEGVDVNLATSGEEEPGAAAQGKEESYISHESTNKDSSTGRDTSKGAGRIKSAGTETPFHIDPDKPVMQQWVRALSNRTHPENQLHPLTSKIETVPLFSSGIVSEEKNRGEK